MSARVSMTRRFYFCGLLGFYALGFALGAFVSGNATLAVIALMAASVITPFVKLTIRAERDSYE